MMKIKYVIPVFFAFLIFCSPNTIENYIEISSIDGKQRFLTETGDAIIYPNTTIDTVLLHELMCDYDFSNKNFQSILKKASDSGNYVLKIDKEKVESDCGWFISVFCEFKGRELINLYHYDMGQHPDYWRLKSAYFEVEYEDDHSYLNIYASLNSVTFALSTFIDFPVNDDGVYSDITRYLNVKTRIDITGTEIIKYFLENK
ncbi:MAG: hypothetical protein GY865_14740 [candidate division Zixibacteria bacterium]|nr:hypothetical protein [candidate division Zixibacteria bacterium]